MLEFSTSGIGEEKRQKAGAGKVLPNILPAASKVQRFSDTRCILCKNLTITSPQQSFIVSQQIVPAKHVSSMSLYLWSVQFDVPNL